MEDLPLSQGNRVTIFTLRDLADVQRLAGDKTGFIQGFYKRKRGGFGRLCGARRSSNATRDAPIGSNIRSQSMNTNMGGETILLHEYSHHLMMQDLEVPYPQWLVEGFAEFMSTAQFEKGLAVGIGLPAGHRYYGLLNGQMLPLETLLSGHYDKITVEQHGVDLRPRLATHPLFDFRAVAQRPASRLSPVAGQRRRAAAGGARQLRRPQEAGARPRWLSAPLEPAISESLGYGIELRADPDHPSVSDRRLGGLPLLAEIKNGVDAKPPKPWRRRFARWNALCRGRAGRDHARRGRTRRQPFRCRRSGGRQRDESRPARHRRHRP